MYTRRGYADKHVSDLDLRAIDQTLALDYTARKARDIVLAVAVHTRHLGRLAANQRTACLTASVGNTRNDGLDLGRFVMADGHIVEEQQRLGTLCQYVVHAHGHGIDTDRIVLVHRKGDLEFGADTVGTAYQNRLPDIERRQIEHAAEGAYVAHDTRARGRSDMRLYSAHHFVSGFEIHAGLFITFSHNLILFLH